MKKITLCFCFIILFCHTINAQYYFPLDVGPINISDSTPLTYNLNDVANGSSVTNNAYQTLRVEAKWQESSGNPLYTDASVEVITTAGSVIGTPVSLLTDFVPNSITFLAVFPANYIPLSDGYLDVIIRQNGVGTSANWSEINISLLACIPPVATATVVEDCNNDQFYIDVNVTDLGSLPPASLDDFNTFYSVSSTGIYTFGPYALDFPILISVTGDSSHGCSYTLEGFSDCTLSVDDLSTKYVWKST